MFKKIYIIFFLLGTPLYIHSEFEGSIHKKIINTHPENFEAQFKLANELFYQKNYLDAINHYHEALRINPHYAQANFNCGLALYAIDRIDEALTFFENAITSDPRYAKAHFYCAEAYKKNNNIENAFKHYKYALEYDITLVQAYLALAELLRNQEHYDEALTCLKYGIQINPEDLQLYSSCAYLFIMLGRVDEAIQMYEEILKRHDTNTHALYNIGYALKMKGNPDQAINFFQQVLKIEPTNESAQFALGLAYLNNGNFKQGWQQHDHYLTRTNRYSLNLKTWIRDHALSGKVILLRPEGGLGDTIQFIRYAQLLKQDGAFIIAMVQPPLIPLLSLCTYIDRIIPATAPLPNYDGFSTIMTLPGVFESTENSIPCNIPYLHADQNLTEAWAEQLTHDKKFKIGICWQADVYNDSSRPKVAHRGISLKQLYPLALLKNVSLYSLQKKDGIEQLDNIPDYFHITCFDNFFDETHGSFMDTAAVMQHMDLIISVDSAVAHLAGALGKRIWLLLPYATDWRWIAYRTDSPWYPTMRIFKQREPFVWSDVITDVIQELQRLTN